MGFHRFFFQKYRSFQFVLMNVLIKSCSLYHLTFQFLWNFGTRNFFVKDSANDAKVLSLYGTFYEKYGGFYLHLLVFPIVYQFILE